MHSRKPGIACLTLLMASLFTVLSGTTSAQINDQGDLVVSASPASSSGDFDFLLGAHTVRHKKLRHRLANSNEWVESEGTHTMEALLGGLGNIEQHHMDTPDGQPVEGVAFRLFNPQTRLWSIYWADSRTVTLDNPVVGSFQGGIGKFFGKDSFNGKPIWVQFVWDARDPAHPVWSQAFSADKGKSWEWNWYMYFSRSDSTTVGVLELRDYLINHGQRDRFVDYFEANLIAPQQSLGGNVLGRYRVKNNEDNFFWMRGFESMKSRSAFLPAFYYGDFWKQHKKIPNGLLANNDNVYLLRPLVLIKDSLVPANSVNSASLNPGKGIAVIDFYISNTKLDKLLKLFANEYLPLWGECGINRYTLWVSEMEKNDFTILPVFQDKNLLVVISFFQNELDYSEKMGLLRSKQNERLAADLLDAVTIKNTIILYSIENHRSF